MTRILLVEDNDLSRDMLSRRLERRGFEIESAVDGRQALTLVEAFRPHLILMDLSLPEIDGWEVLRRLRSDPILKRIPAIALTAHALASDRSRALEAGFNDYDSKPVDFTRLLAKIQLVLPRE